MNYGRYHLKILIVKTSSLGGIIQTFPVLNYLRERFDSLHIDWVVEEKFASLVKDHPFVDRVFSFDLSGLKKKFYSRPKLKPVIKKTEYNY